MAELMARGTNTKVTTFKKGDRVEGIVTKLSKSEIAVDINAKSEATVLEKDRRLANTLLSLLKIGDKVTVSILNPESDTGQPVVSLRRFIDEHAWGKLEDLQKQQKMIPVTVTEITRGGYVVGTDFGISGFLPMSHTSFSQNQQITIGLKLSVLVLELNKKDNKIIFSQKTTLSDSEFSDLAKKLPVGTKMTVTITNVTDHGIHVSIPVTLPGNSESQLLDGYIHISEVAWEKVDNLPNMYTVGDEIEAVVSKYNKQTKRIDLSIKQLSQDPFSELVADFPVDKRVSGSVVDIDSVGVHIRLSDVVTGIIRKEQVPPTVSYTPGQSVNVVVSEVDARRHRLYLAPVLLEKPIGYR